MKVVIFGATGMVGNSVLRECLDDPRNAQTVLVDVSGESADSAQTSRTMWKHVRGGVENDCSHVGKAMITLAVNTPDLPERVLRSDGINALAHA